MNDTAGLDSRGVVDALSHWIASHNSKGDPNASLPLLINLTLVNKAYFEGLVRAGIRRVREMQPLCHRLVETEWLPKKILDPDSNEELVLAMRLECIALSWLMEFSKLGARAFTTDTGGGDGGGELRRAGRRRAAMDLCDAARAVQRACCRSLPTAVHALRCARCMRAPRVSWWELVSTCRGEADEPAPAAGALGRENVAGEIV